MASKMIINLDDKNLPTSGEAWKAMVAHVLYNVSYDEIMPEINDDWITEYIKDEDYGIADLFDDDDVRNHIHESGIPLDDIYDDDDILESNCVKTLIASLLEKVKIRTAEYEEKMTGLFKEGLAKLEKRNAELERKLAVSNEALVCLGYRVDDEPCEVEETVDDDTILKGVECRKCGNTLPPHTVRTHLTKDAPILTCPHKTEE